MTFDVSAIVDVEQAALAAGLLIGAAVVTLKLYIGAFRYFKDVWDTHRRYRGGFDDVE